MIWCYVRNKMYNQDLIRKHYRFLNITNDYFDQWKISPKLMFLHILFNTKGYQTLEIRISWHHPTLVTWWSQWNRYVLKIRVIFLFSKTTRHRLKIFPWTPQKRFDCESGNLEVGKCLACLMGLRCARARFILVILSVIKIPDVVG